MERVRATIVDPGPASREARSDVKLLLVEDDMKIAAMLRRGLEAEGFTVELAVGRR